MSSHLHLSRDVLERSLTYCEQILLFWLQRKSLNDFCEIDPKLVPDIFRIEILYSNSPCDLKVVIFNLDQRKE